MRFLLLVIALHVFTPFIFAQSVTVTPSPSPYPPRSLRYSCDASAWKYMVNWEAPATPGNLTNYVVRTNYAELPLSAPLQPWLIDNGVDSALWFPGTATSQIIDIFPYKNYSSVSVQSIRGGQYKLPDSFDSVSGSSSFSCFPLPSASQNCSLTDTDGTRCTLEGVAAQLATTRGYPIPVGGAASSVFQDANADKYLSVRDFEIIRAYQYDKVTPTPIRTPTAPTPTPGALSTKQRFGLGFNPMNCSSYERTPGEFGYSQLNIGWYTDWSYKGGARSDMEYLALVGGYGKNVAVQEQSCQQVTAYVQANRSKYPAGAMWTVGNEIGYDDGRSSDEYVRDFTFWKNCIKSIDPSFRVGTGAIISPWTTLPRGSNECIADLSKYNTDQTSGANYFRRIITGLRANNAMPDFIVNHAYTLCQSPKDQPDDMKESLRIQRTLMKELGIQNLDLVIKEFSPLYTPDVATAQRYMQQTIPYMLTTTDPAIGKPGDGNRLVQRFAWFVGNEWKNYKKDASGAYACNNPLITPAVRQGPVALFDTYTTVILPLGNTFKSIREQYP